MQADADPPVCKLQNYALSMKEQNLKIKENKQKAKQREMREIHIGVSSRPENKNSLLMFLVQANIDDHDLQHKMNKVKEFLDEKIEVRIVINSDKNILAKFPQAMDRTTLKLLERVEGLVSAVRQPQVKFSEYRKDFILSPK